MTPFLTLECFYCHKIFTRQPWQARAARHFCSVPCHHAAQAQEARAAFWAKTEKTAHCWLWQGSLSKDGYGNVNLRLHGQRVYLAHRAAWILMHGPVLPLAQEINVLHRCDQPRCCNPAHLFLGTRKDNSQDASAKRRFHHEGERNGRAKLSAEQVQEIRALKGQVLQRKIAQQFGISKALVGFIHSRRVWKHLPELD